MEEFRKDQGEGEAGRKPGSRRKRRFRWIDLGIALVFLIGLCIMLYPMVSDYINRIQVANVLSDYEKTIKEIPIGISTLPKLSAALNLLCMIPRNALKYLKNKKSISNRMLFFVSLSVLTYS